MNDINSSFKVESLQKEYDVILQQYQEAVKNYISSLQSNTYNFTSLQGRTWWGKNSLSEGPVNDEKECENMCANSDKCSGATFNSVKRYCWTRSGDNEITAGTDSDYALITEQKAILSMMKYFNEKLLNLNKQIRDELKNTNTEVKQQYDNKNQKQQEMYYYYKKLLEQKIELDKQIKEYYSIEEDESNQTIYVNQQNIYFKIWIIITCLILLITVNKIFNINNYASFSLIVIIILTYSLRNPSGFFILFIFFIFIFIFTKF